MLNSQFPGETNETEKFDEFMTPTLSYIHYFLVQISIGTEIMVRKKHIWLRFETQPCLLHKKQQLIQGTKIQGIKIQITLILH